MTPETGQPDTHPKLLSRERAAKYLGFENPATLDWCRSQGFLVAYTAGKQTMYWRDDLDDCAMKIVGLEPTPRVKKPMRMAQ